ncbi:PKD domain-containing protein [Hymenobacter terrigena]
MRSSFRQSVVLLALGAAALGACRKKEVDSLEGPVPTAAFTVALNTTQYPVVATFTNTSTDGFLYQWDFGDGSPLVTGVNVTHTYTLPRTYQVKLVVAGRGGTGYTPVDVTIPSICSNAAYSALIDCGKNNTTSWTYSDQPGAIKTFAADGTTQLSASAAPLPDCQGDDQFQFNQNFAYTYDGGDNCGPDLNGTSGFIFRPTANGLGQIVLQRPKSFIGLTDSVVNKTYDIVEASATVLRLRGTKPNGTITEVTLMPTPPPLLLTERRLTGGSSRTWVLDNTVANTITVGTEAAPTSYFAGGALGSLPGCQADDEYTFTSSHNFIYDAKAETFVAGAYSCQAPRSLTTTFTFGQAAGSGVGQFVLALPTSPTAPAPFIAATDAGSDRTYRILSINNRNMVLRTLGAPVPAGTPATVFTIKLRVK